MRNKKLKAFMLCCANAFGLLTGCSTFANSGLAVTTKTTMGEKNVAGTALSIAEQGIFSAGGITITSDGIFDPENQWEESGAGQTAHVGHANVPYGCFDVKK